MDSEDIYVLEINEYLLQIEDIISKYIRLPDDLVFVNGVRLPVINKSEVSYLIERGHVTNKPTMPYISAYMFKDIFTKYIIDNNPDRDLLYVNEVDDRVDHVYDVDRYTEIDDIIYSFINDITELDKDTILSLMNIIVAKHIHIVEAMPYCIYSINVDNEYMILKRLDDIRVYRYKQIIKGLENDS